LGVKVNSDFKKGVVAHATEEGLAKKEGRRRE
jgi:hypothetical protein